MKVESAKEQMDKLLKFCERPGSRVRFRFADGEWAETSGPEFLEQFKANQSGGVSIDWVKQVVHGEDGS